MDARASLYLLLPFLVLLAIKVPRSNFQLCDGHLRIECTLPGGAGTATLNFTNNCPYTVWPGTLTSGGGGQLSSTGFELAIGASFSFYDILDTWSAPVWGRMGCAINASVKFVCATAYCSSGQVSCNGAGAIQPASLAEFTLVAAGSGEQDFYNISLVDGFNLPLSATPQGSGSGCSTTSCATNINSMCPSELAVRGSDGSIVTCKSACLAFNQPQYCCTGGYGTPDTCPPTDYSKIFKNQCPQAYSYAYDDKSSTSTCAGGVDYPILFCP